MSNEEIEQRLREIGQHSLDTDYFLRALIQLLVERKVLKGKEREVFSLLEQWASGLAEEEVALARAKERARLLIEQSEKLPRQ